MWAVVHNGTESLPWRLSGFSRRQSISVRPIRSIDDDFLGARTVFTQPHELARRSLA